MTDYTELLELLRYCSSKSGCIGCKLSEAYDCTADLTRDAAAAIEALEAKVADYEDTLKWHQKEFAELRAMIDDANSRLEVGKAGNKFTLNATEQPHWVSVFDDLPRHNAIVVVSDGKRSWDVGQYHFLFKDDDRTIWWWKKHTTKKVLWWMYKEDALPQPPQEAQE